MAPELHPAFLYPDAAVTEPPRWQPTLDHPAECHHQPEPDRRHRQSRPRPRPRPIRAQDDRM